MWEGESMCFHMVLHTFVRFSRHSVQATRIASTLRRVRPERREPVSSSSDLLSREDDGCPKVLVLLGDNLMLSLSAGVAELLEATASEPDAVPVTGRDEPGGSKDGLGIAIDSASK